ncbi:hypothetical protein Q7C_431 [Methylophaga frappieri]|uniref:Uncharacterized protein n=1 Tax=Methylophaga frappieri (strain ATCC BAA-2434 / DSM 25690 / JAM7) TaxID=754477 RepID=I1YFB3_METFJ|nr:hypothetical protein Q7C_431 [Methylophaga frappieri]
MHLLAIIAILIATLSVGMKLAIIIFVAWHYVYFFKRRQASLRQFLIVDDATGWQLTDEQGHACLITIKQCFVSLPLIIIHYHTQQKGKRSLVLFCDSISAEHGRQLRIRLSQPVGPQ